ncbi:MAG: LysM domain-containing protein [Bacilli bacterium]|nr:LysM domain-containing protein [Bacilli bacterium]
MQKIFFHKTVNLDNPLKELLSISVDESIQYKIEFNGMRAIGSIIIHGEYDDGQKRNTFHENIDLDVLAQFEKIEDKRDFHMKVEDFDYTLQNGVLKLIIQTHIYGVRDDEDKHIYVNEERTNDIQKIESEKVLEVIEPHIEALLREEDKKEMVNELNDEVEEVIEPSVPETQAINNNEENLDEDIGTYYFYIVQSGDSYHTIAARYNVDENMIKDYNRHREVVEGNIIIVPYIP